MPSAATGLPARLAARIVAQARQQNLPVGAHITEQSVADSFRVSRSPVRKALALLARQGVLVRETNRGYFVKALSDAPRRQLAVAVDETEERYLRIADDRLAGRVEDHVTETELMQR